MADSEFIFEANLENFDQVVVEKSFSIPILVDFWAGWCNPCKMLMPLLETVVNEYSGKFLIAKVDTDREQKLAGKYGIQGLPTVKLFVEGKVVSEFSGVQPLPAIKAFLEPYLPRESDNIREQAIAKISENKIEEAIELLRQGSKQDVNNIMLHLDLLDTLLLTNQVSEAEQHLNSLPVNVSHDQKFTAVKARLFLAKLLQNPPSIEADNLSSLQIAIKDLLSEKHESGLNRLVDLLEKNPKEKTVYRDALLHGIELLEDSPEARSLASRVRSRMFTFLH